jgi:polyisoprenoid-binding protein YceI
MRLVNNSAGLAAIAGLSVLVSACGAPSEGPPAASAAPTTNVLPTTVLAQAEPTVADAPTAAARPTQPAAPATPTQPPAAQAATATPVAGPTTSAKTDAVRLTLDSSASQASYHAREVLVGHTLATDAVGTSPSVSGSLLLGADGSIAAEQSTITVDLTKLKSDESRRDNLIKNETLQTGRFPTATFVGHEVQGLPMPLPTSGEVTFQLLGDLTVHGVTKPVTWQVTAQFADSKISGSATTGVKITDFGMTPPKVGPVLSIEDGLNLELAFTANREA